MTYNDLCPSQQFCCLCVCSFLQYRLIGSPFQAARGMGCSPFPREQSSEPLTTQTGSYSYKEQSHSYTTQLQLHREAQQRHWSPGRGSNIPPSHSA